MRPAFFFLSLASSRVEKIPGPAMMAASREALKARRETLGDRHKSTLTSIANLGSLLEARGNLAGAEELLREAQDVGAS